MTPEAADTEALDVAIIGAGLCGLQLATLLQPAGGRLAVFEARARIGGRILTVAGGALDLGPTWFWPRTQPRMTQLVAELGLPSIRQHDDGRALYHDQADQPPRTVAAADLHGGAQRLDGGMARLAAALAERLPAATLRLQHRLRELVRQGDHIELQMRRGAEAVALRATGRAGVAAAVGGRVHPFHAGAAGAAARRTARNADLDGERGQGGDAIPHSVLARGGP